MGDATTVAVGPRGQLRDMTPTLLDYLYSDQRVTLLVTAATFLGACGVGLSRTDRRGLSAAQRGGMGVLSPRRQHDDTLPRVYPSRRTAAARSDTCEPDTANTRTNSLPA